MSFLSSIIANIGLDKVLPALEKAVGVDILIPLVEEGLVAQAKAEGHTGVERAVTMPQAFVQSMCAKTGADYDTQIALRDKAAAAEADFIMGFFPDPPVPVPAVPAVVD